MNKARESLSNNKTGIMIMILSAVCTSFGQYFWKISQAQNLKYLFIGFVLYGAGAVFMVLAFRFGKFSVIHPVLSLGYIFAFIIGALLLNEHINVPKVGGLVFILFGVIMIGVGDE